MRPGIDPKVDYAFKRLFGSEANLPLLRHLLHAVLRPPAGQEIVDLVLLNPFYEKETFGDKLSIVDIKARDERNRQFTIEMQMIAPWFFPSRALYYWAKLHQQQMQEGDDWRVLRPTISICFVNSVLFPQVLGYHRAFRLLEVTSHVALTDDLAIHLIELPRFELAGEQLTNDLEVWCYFLRHGESLDTEHLPATLNIPPILQALEALNVLTQSDLERERYEAQRRAQRDEFTRQAELADAQAELADAQERARKAREEGLLVGRIHLCQRLLKQPLTPESELSALPLEHLSALAEQLESQVLPPSS